jgi:hypothetical protein
MKNTTPLPPTSPPNPEKMIGFVSCIQTALSSKHITVLKQILMACWRIYNDQVLSSFYSSLLTFATISSNHISENKITENDRVSKFNWRLSFYYSTTVVEKCLYFPAHIKSFFNQLLRFSGHYRWWTPSQENKTTPHNSIYLSSWSSHDPVIGMSY